MRLDNLDRGVQYELADLAGLVAVAERRMRALQLSTQLPVEVALRTPPALEPLDQLTPPQQLGLSALELRPETLDFSLRPLLADPAASSSARARSSNATAAAPARPCAIPLAHCSRPTNVTTLLPAFGRVASPLRATAAGVAIGPSTATLTTQLESSSEWRSSIVTLHDIVRRWELQLEARSIRAARPSRAVVCICSAWRSDQPRAPVL